MDVNLTDDPDPIEILLVEDNESDIELTRESLEQSKLLVNLNVVRDGRAAIDYLRRNDSYEDATRPDIILLDLNLPKLSGQKVLEKIKNDEELKSIPVAVLSASEAQEDIEKSYEEHANCYITKPLGFKDFQELVKQFENFWFSIVRLPE
jgi:CheY-like chemotaxis protein